MNSTSLFIPNKINVGFQKREDTYTQKLAYIIYYDEKGVLRKENSWQSWRDQSIPNIEFDNIPTEGFVLNKHTGGHKSGWNYRQSYIRVYDPRDFEFEITLENLLYILEYCDCVKGKQLEGKFVYSWNGTELVLLPENSSDYQELVNYNKMLAEPQKITNSLLVPGFTYLDKKNIPLLYLGRFEMFESYRNNNSLGQRYIFLDLNSYSNGQREFGICIRNFNSINGKLINVISDDIPKDFFDYIDKLNHCKVISPIDEQHFDKKYLTFDEWCDYVMDSNNYHCFALFIDYNNQDNVRINVWNSDNNFSYHTIEKDSLISVDIRDDSKGQYHRETILEKKTLQEVFDIFKIYYKVRYLKNGNIYDTSINEKYW